MTARAEPTRRALLAARRDVHFGAAVYGSFLVASLVGVAFEAGQDARVTTLPTAINAVYGAAVAAALHPVFQTAAAVMVVAFALSWRLRDVPLRETTQAPVGLGARTANARRIESIRRAEMSALTA